MRRGCKLTSTACVVSLTTVSRARTPIAGIDRLRVTDTPTIRGSPNPSSRFEGAAERQIMAIEHLPNSKKYLSRRGCSSSFGRHTAGGNKVPSDLLRACKAAVSIFGSGRSAMLARPITGYGPARPLFNFALSMAVYACYFQDLGPG